MATAKKWSVTYTKHVKQKRKVYQDGFLTFDSSSNKVMLCDSSEKLLECRLLKSDEVVRCGETLVFNAYLVDVGDLEGGDRPFNSVSSYSCATNIDDIQNQHDRISSKENEKSKVEKSRAGTTALSPSQNVTRGTHFRGLKRREINKYGMLSKSPDSVPTTAGGILPLSWLYRSELPLSFTGQCRKEALPCCIWKVLSTNLTKYNRKPPSIVKIIWELPFSIHHISNFLFDYCYWHVLYTAQLTQKAKKYHDGYLRFTNSGSLNIQVQLYDENWSLLDSRFMKKPEEVKPGEKMAFHAHVVEVVEPRGNHGNSTSLYTARNSNQSFQQLHEKNVPNDLKLHKPVVKEEKGVENAFSSPKSNFTNGELIRAEWQVLYTAQVTKKAKTYRDGFLQLMIRGSLGRQITLYDESRRVLNNRFLEKHELIQSGKSIAFDGYLVDIGAPEGQGRIPVDLGNEEVVHGYDKTKKHVNFHKPVIRQSIQKGQLSGRNLERSSSVSDCSSNAGISIVKEAEQTERSSMRKPLRDARQILSILRNPCSEEKGIAPSSDANKGISDSSDNSTKPASNGVSSIEIVDFQASELALGCTENQLAQTLQVQDIDKLCYDNESNAQGGWSDPTSSHPLRHSDEMSMFGPIKTDPEMHMEFPSFNLGF